eukprot:Gb_12325 [translate_table: standard]
MIEGGARQFAEDIPQGNNLVNVHVKNGGIVDARPEGTTLEATLDLLCLNILGNELPLKFSSRVSITGHEGEERSDFENGITYLRLGNSLRTKNKRFESFVPILDTLLEKARHKLTVVDLKSYLTDLKSMKITSDVEIIAKIRYSD